MSQMVTTCPNCRQALAVTAADLRVGQGYVRCGRCDKVFNALLTLAEDMPAPREPESVAHGTRSVPMLQEEALPPLPGRGDAIPFGTMSDEDEVEVVRTHATGEFRAPPQPESVEAAEVGEAPDLPTENAADIAEAAGAAAVVREQVARDIIRQATSQPIDVLLEERDVPAAPPPPRRTSDELFDADAAVGNAPRTSRWWHVAALVLLLALAAQFVHHNRHTLAAVPWLAGPLQSVYGLFGTAVEPAWDLTQYEVQELGATAPGGATGSLLLQAAVAVKKDARLAQPPPVLRVVLSDRFGNVLSTTDVAPREWLLGAAPARMDPGQRLDARLALPAEQRASGFGLEPCLPDTRGSLRCLNDPR